MKNYTNIYLKVKVGLDLDYSMYTYIHTYIHTVHHTHTYVILGQSYIQYMHIMYVCIQYVHTIILLYVLYYMYTERIYTVLILSLLNNVCIQYVHTTGTVCMYIIYRSLVILQINYIHTIHT
jgi:hypothetical protein